MPWNAVDSHRPSPKGKHHLSFLQQRDACHWARKDVPQQRKRAFQPRQLFPANSPQLSEAPQLLVTSLWCAVRGRWLGACHLRHLHKHMKAVWPVL